MIQVLVIDNEGTTTHILHLHGSRSASTRAPLKSINQEHPQCHPQSLNVSLSPTGHRQDPSRTTEPEPAEARLDCVVFGRVAGRAAAKWLGGSRGLADPMEVNGSRRKCRKRVQLYLLRSSCCGFCGSLGTGLVRNHPSTAGSCWLEDVTMEVGVTLRFCFVALYIPDQHIAPLSPRCRGGTLWVRHTADVQRCSTRCTALCPSCPPPYMADVLPF